MEEFLESLIKISLLMWTKFLEISIIIFANILF